MGLGGLGGWLRFCVGFARADLVSIYLPSAGTGPLRQINNPRVGKDRAAIRFGNATRAGPLPTRSNARQMQLFPRVPENSPTEELDLSSLWGLVHIQMFPPSFSEALRNTGVYSSINGFGNGYQNIGGFQLSEHSMDKRSGA